MQDKIAVLFGGTSAEREVSLKSGNAVLQGLLKKGLNAIAVDTKTDDVMLLKQKGFTKAFIALHGRGGEDGITQALLTHQQIPYTGSNVLASSLAMNKLKTKQIWKSLDLPIANYVSLIKGQTIDINSIVEQLGLPLFIKPINEGSSVGMSQVNHANELLKAIEKAFQHDSLVMIEAFLSGFEYTVGIVDNQVLPSIRIETQSEFYDYEAKYNSNETRYHCPSGLSEEREQEIRHLAKNAYDAISCSGWGRVDVMCDEFGQFKLLEVNTSPGMTDHSLIPMAGRQAGFSFEDLVERILSTARY